MREGGRERERYGRSIFNRGTMQGARDVKKKSKRVNRDWCYEGTHIHTHTNKCTHTHTHTHTHLNGVKVVHVTAEQR